MWRNIELDDLTEGFLLAGQKVSPGYYRNVETGQRVQFEQDGLLPPSFDGRVACYVPLPTTWNQQVASMNVEREHQSTRLG